MANEMEDVVRDFLDESRENLDRIDLDLVALEQVPDATELIGRIFRTIHTIKGTCGFLGFARLEAVTHAGENVLSAMRDEEIAPTSTTTSALLAMVDAVRDMLACIETTGNDGHEDHAALVARLTRIHRGHASADAAGTAPSLPDVPASSATPAPVAPTDRLLTQLANLPNTSNNHTTPAPDSATVPSPAPDASASRETTIRVDVGLLDKLMNLVGELVLARNQIVQLSRPIGHSPLIGAAQRLNLITSELQEGVMKTRMQPIGNIWHKFPRVVRDLALSCEKRVALHMEGEQTELDKTLIEAIKDPLTHLVRNAIDHGIEPPAQRVAAGKSAEGRLSLRAFHEGGQVNIEVSDDGAGLDAERIRHKAIERGIVSVEQATRLSEREVFDLVFLPGFSTAAKVTNVSGRGVGMDVVRTNIEKIGGTIDLQGKRGLGTTIKIKIPLTLAIIPAVIVASGANRYAIPQVSLLELVRLEGEQARQGIEMLHGAPVHRLRGKLLPLVRLSEALEARPSGTDDVLNLVVLQADDRQFGLIVDGVHDTEEIVVKPLGKHLKGSPVFAGATIMGDGRVALILDILGLARRARVVAEARERGRLDASRLTPVSDEERHTLLLFRTPDDGRMAIPLSRVARLEELAPSAIERAGHERLVQYRGEIMPVLELSSLLPERRAVPRAPAPTGHDKLQVVVFSHHGQHVGLVVEEILDIVEDSLKNRRPPGRAGVLGTVVIAGRVTELLDVESILERASTTLARPSTPAEVSAHGA
jgi:two-component system, chemotaxis family, sensor kinase CheA